MKVVEMDVLRAANLADSKVAMKVRKMVDWKVATLAQM